MKLSGKLLAPLFLTTTIIALVLWILSRSINPDTIKEYVINNLTALTSQPSRIEGQISWQIFPQPGIKIHDIQVGDPANKEGYSLKLDNLFLNLKLMPLFRGKLVFGNIKVDGFNFKINTDSPIPVLTEKNTIAIQNRLLNSQFIIERLLLSHGQMTFTHNTHLFTFTETQIGAEKIDLQQDTFPFQFKSTLAYRNANIPIAKAQIQFKGSTNATTTLISNPSLLLKSLKMNGQLLVQKAHFATFKVTKISASTNFKNNVLNLNPLTINLYQGESVGNLRYELSHKILDINVTANSLNSAKLTEDLFYKKLLRGTLDLSLHTHTDFRKTTWQESSTANGNVSMKDGSVESLNMNTIIDITSKKINSIFSGKNQNKDSILALTSFDNPEFFKGTTPFSLMTLKYRLEKAVLSSDAIYLQAQGLQIKGESKINLNNDLLESHLQVMVALAQPGVASIQQLLGGNFPIVIKGSLTNPIVLPDLKKINPVFARFLIKNTLEQPVREIKKQLTSLFKK